MYRKLTCIPAILVVVLNLGLMPVWSETLTEASATRLIVQFEPGVQQKLTAGSRSKADATLASQLALPAGARIHESGFTQWRRQQLRAKGRDDQKELGALQLNHRIIIELPSTSLASTTLANLKRHPWVLIAEVDHVGQGGGLIPSDPNYAQQWHHTKIASSNAWSRTIGSSNVIVAVLDTGIRSNLNEFAGRLLPGYDFANNDADPYDDHGHGTAVTGVMGANGNNGILVAGMDWQCKILPVKVLDAGNSGLYSWWTDGIDWAVSNGAKVITISAGGSLWSDSMALAISNAINQGVIFVTISHNDGTGSIRFPGILGASITVGATTNTDLRAVFSNYGSELDLVAPGQVIATVSSNGTLQYWSGTSFAGPMVAGLCSLLASIHPDLNQSSALALLKGGAEDRVGDGADTPGFDIYYGYGRINAQYTLWLAESAMTAMDAPTTNSIRLTWSSPPSASNQTPFGIAYAESTTSTWTKINSPSNLVYTSTTTEWTDTGAQTGSPPGQRRIYRHFIR